MREHLGNIDKAFENSIRLSIMALLMVNRTIDFNALKKLLGTTDGNLSSNLSYMSDQKYVVAKKKFINNKPNTSYAATEKGSKAFRIHIDAMQKIISYGK